MQKGENNGTITQPQQQWPSIWTVWLGQGKWHGKSSATVSLLCIVDHRRYKTVCNTLPFSEFTILCNFDTMPKHHTSNRKQQSVNRFLVSFFFSFTIYGPNRPVNEHTMGNEQQHRGERIDTDVCIAIWLFWLWLIVQYGMGQMSVLRNRWIYWLLESWWENRWKTKSTRRRRLSTDRMNYFIFKSILLKMEFFLFRFSLSRVNGGNVHFTHP